MSVGRRPLRTAASIKNLLRLSAWNGCLRVAISHSTMPNEYLRVAACRTARRSSSWQPTLAGGSNCVIDLFHFVVICFIFFDLLCGVVASHC